MEEKLEKNAAKRPFYRTVAALSFPGKGEKIPADVRFLDFLSGFAYNKLELIWITIAL